MPHSRLTLESAPSGKFYESPAYPGATLFKLEHATCKGFNPAGRFTTKRSWSYVVLHTSHLDSARQMRWTFVPIPPENLDLAEEATEVHLTAALPEHCTLVLEVLTGKKALAVNFVPNAQKRDDQGFKPGVKRLLAAASRVTYANGHDSSAVA